MSIEDMHRKMVSGRKMLSGLINILESKESLAALVESGVLREQVVNMTCFCDQHFQEVETELGRRSSKLFQELMEELKGDVETQLKVNKAIQQIAEKAKESR